MMKHFGFPPVFILVVFLGFHPVLPAHAAAGGQNTSLERADAIVIDTLSIFGRLEKPPVTFLHDAHTAALASSEPSCQLCHLKIENAFYPRFKRTEDKSRIDLMNLYHRDCISCHGDMRLKKETSGPVECDKCHQKGNTVRAARQPMGFDSSLHYRHSTALEKKCETCHHEYDEQIKKRVYIQGKEGTCRYCHKEKTADNRISMGEASHLACINCHIGIPKKTQVLPPVTCRGCHDPGVLQKTKTIRPVPRMEQGQPDLIVVHTGSFHNIEEDRINPVGVVPFDHKTHENAGNTCRTCHHESFETCGRCHTPDESGKNLSDNRFLTAPTKEIPVMEKTMHAKSSTASCIGCHNAQKKAGSCAGCHGLTRQGKTLSEEACQKCHVRSGPSKAVPEDRKGREALASVLRSAMKPEKQKTAPGKVPDHITIERLANKYKAVDFPHGKIIKALSQGMGDNRLALHFHGPTSLCAGCHHNSPASEKPPACTGCHTGTWNATHPERPGILGAYHRQCIGCHKAMGLKQNNDCTTCHELK